jgi:hypothetical protein
LRAKGDGTGYCSTPEPVTSTWWPLCSSRSTAAAIGETTAPPRTEQSLDTSAELSLLVRTSSRLEVAGDFRFDRRAAC